ncbi:MAG: hypothetical protein M3442_13795 [Chloroflexota bacterium]|nr:hypothetical protein [Chloroflexota bacterium]
MTVVPSRLEYAAGFDLAASWLGSDGYPLLAVVSTAEFVDHVAARAEGGVAFACDDASTRDHARQRLSGGGLPGDVAEQSRVLPPVETVPAGAMFRGVLWAAPQPTTWPAKLASLGRLLAAGGRVCVLTGTTASVLARPVRRRQPGEPAPLLSTLRTHLVADGWRVTHTRGLGGIASIGWAVAGRAAQVAGRPDLADRAEQAHHQAVEESAGASYVVLLAQRGTQP